MPGTADFPQEQGAIVTIDVHTHVVPATFPPCPGLPEPRWPRMCACDIPGHRRVMIGDRPFRDVTDQSWDVGRRADDMQAEAVAHQVLSPMPELLSYWFDAEKSQAMASWMNEQIGAMVAASPARFSGLGMVPLQNPGQAARVAETLRRDYGLLGVEVGTNVNGKPIGHPDHAEFFAAAVEHDLAVFVHALHPAGRDRVIGPPVMEALVAFPNENAFAVSSMITGGMLDKFPSLRIGFSHGGGGFGLVLPRLQSGWESMTNTPAGPFVTRPPIEYAQMMYYDSLVYDDRALRYLIDVFGVTQVMVGSDYPFLIREARPGDRIIGLGLDEDVRRGILHGNARRFLRLAPSVGQ
jgi:aminocarboxymuconate-semialdehyde decarboxylase